MEPNDAYPPVFVDEDQDLAWAPGAAPLSMRYQNGRWVMGESFQVKNLRAANAQGQATCVALDGHGRMYYRPHWAAFTALLDARNPGERKVAAKALGNLDPLARAPELGFYFPAAFYLLRRQSPAAIGDLAQWDKEHAPWAVYFSQLSDHHKARLARARMEDWGLLETALRRRHFRAAEQLWQAGCRFSPNMLADGGALWTMVVAGYADTPAISDTYEHWRKLPAGEARFFEPILADEATRAPEALARDWPPGTEPLRNIALVTQRWLRRLVQEGANVNATTAMAAQGREGIEGRPILRTAFMHILAQPPERAESSLMDAWTQVWLEAMEQGGYRFSAPMDDWVILGDQGGTALEYGRATGLSEPLQARIHDHILREKLDARPQARPAPRL